MALQVEIVSAEHEVFSGKADYVIAPAFAGDVGIYPQHAPLLTLLKPGEVRIGYIQEKKKQEHCFYVSGGFLEVQPEVVSILADVGERGEDLDEQAVLEAEKRAKEMLAGQGDDKKDYQAALNTLAQASAQLRLIKRLKKTK